MTKKICSAHVGEPSTARSWTKIQGFIDSLYSLLWHKTGQDLRPNSVSLVMPISQQSLQGPKRDMWRSSRRQGAPALRRWSEPVLNGQPHSVLMKISYILIGYQFEVKFDFVWSIPPDWQVLIWINMHGSMDLYCSHRFSMREAWQTRSSGSRRPPSAALQLRSSVNILWSYW